MVMCYTLDNVDCDMPAILYLYKSFPGEYYFLNNMLGKLF